MEREGIYLNTASINLTEDFTHFGSNYCSELSEIVTINFK